MKKSLTPARAAVGALASIVMLSAILAANWVTTDYGFIPVGFGFMATAGTIFAGISLASRDLVQDAVGRWPVVALILIGTALSFLLAAPFIAIASAAAYLTSESLDFLVYTPLRRRSVLGDRRWAVAVVASNVVGAVADTLVFLSIAFGVASILPALAGQLVGKTWATVAYLVVGFAIARLVARKARAKEAERAELVDA